LLGKSSFLAVGVAFTVLSKRALSLTPPPRGADVRRFSFSNTLFLERELGWSGVW
jgi:hypothetical protein